MEESKEESEVGSRIMEKEISLSAKNKFQRQTPNAVQDSIEESKEVGSRIMEKEDISLGAKNEFQRQTPNAEDVSKKKIMDLIIENVSRNKATIGKDEQGNRIIICNNSKFQITTKQKQYREGEEFEKMEIIGVGNVAGNIYSAKDLGSGVEHALKTVMISYLIPNEIFALFDLEGSGISPSLYLIRQEDNKICLHMEKLESAVTLKAVLEDLKPIPKDYVRPFALYVFKGLLKAVKIMYDRKWCHRDLHEGNIMIQKNSQSLDIKVIDFGNANKIYGPKSIDFDILQTIRQFSALYTGQMFDNAYDLKKNYREKLREMCKILKFSKADKEDLFRLVVMALNFTIEAQKNSNNSNLANIDDVVSEIDKQLKPVDVDEMCKEVAAVLFTESEYHDLHKDIDLGSKDSMEKPEKKEVGARMNEDEEIRLQKKSHFQNCPENAGSEVDCVNSPEI